MRELSADSDSPTHPLLGPIAVETIEVEAAHPQAVGRVHEVRIGPAHQIAADDVAGDRFHAELLTTAAKRSAIADLFHAARKPTNVEVVFFQNDRADNARVAVHANAKREPTGLRLVHINVVVELPRRDVLHERIARSTTERCQRSRHLSHQSRGFDVCRVRALAADHGTFGEEQRMSLDALQALFREIIGVRTLSANRSRLNDLQPSGIRLIRNLGDLHARGSRSGDRRVVLQVCVRSAEPSSDLRDRRDATGCD